MRKIYVVGIGPGKEEGMTGEALKALEESEVIAGYQVYVDLVKNAFPEKEFLATSMTKEKERCELAFAEAMKGKTVSMICSGDAGVYGMSGLMLEIGQRFPEVEVEMVSGVTAALSGACVLGAPLVHDFAVISLSDLLTPMEKIEKRLSCAAQADFVIVLYNPGSKKRKDYLKKACERILEYRSPRTVCGLACHIGREGQQGEILTLEELKERQVNMFTTVFIGNSQTKVINGKMVTPRGYDVEKDGLL